MRKAVIVSAVRTPLGSFNGTLAAVGRNQARRHRHRGGHPAGGDRQGGGERGHHGPGAALRLRPEPGQAGGRPRPDALGSGGYHRQQGLRFGPQGRDARRPGRPDRGRRRGGGRRHGEHERRTLLPREGALRLPHGAGDDPGPHGPRRAVGHRQRLPHGHLQRPVLPEVQCQPRGPGPLRGRVLSPGARGRQGRHLR